ncbi:hypothetical protein QLI93_001572 [Listeria monocytogenes]|nr:hypothetical protein [Listeria monocytogenes]EAC8001219.1 hypothetical protein [Listeria monocytogenes]EJC6460093.1 hypothetical protein [Listeria monocytogenes]EJT8453027.1 hypothetical protein [Listeria monocytogenes]EKZ7015215.1 hypothetical protein [Listeria monocytogenes]
MFLTKQEKNLKLLHMVMQRDTQLNSKIGFSQSSLPLDWGDLEMLSSLGFITMDTSTKPYWTIFLTDEGVSYFENSKIKTKDFILKSFLAPIIVSAITTLITLWLTGSL